MKYETIRSKSGDFDLLLRVSTRKGFVIVRHFQSLCLIFVIRPVGLLFWTICFKKIYIQCAMRNDNHSSVFVSCSFCFEDNLLRSETNFKSFYFHRSKNECSIQVTRLSQSRMIQRDMVLGVVNEPMHFFNEP